jgi:hypothetical protein
MQDVKERAKWKCPTADPLVLLPFKHYKAGPKERRKQPLLDILRSLGWSDLVKRFVEEMNVNFARPPRLLPPTTKAGSPRLRQPNTEKPMGWRPGNKPVMRITEDEFNGFIAAWIEMWLDKKPCLEEYWGGRLGNKEEEGVAGKEEGSDKKRMEGNTFIKELWARDDWRKIFVALYHLDTKTLDWMEDIFNEKIAENYTPCSSVTLDEMGYPFKGMSRNRTYNPAKPNKWCLKFYGLVDGMGVCTRLRFYKGELKTEKKKKKQGITTDLVTNFAAHLPRDMGGYIFCCDNYYTSLEAARAVRALGHHFIGTCRANRPSVLFGEMLHVALGIKKNKKKKVRDVASEEARKEKPPLPNGGEPMEDWEETEVESTERMMERIDLSGTLPESLQGKCKIWDLGEGKPTLATTFNEEDGLFALTWKDKSAVNIITDIGVDEVVEVMRKKERLGENQRILKPTACITYSKHMGHCDAFDGDALRYRPHQKNLVWRRAKFCALLKYLLLNGMSIAAQQGHRFLDQKNFLRNLRDELGTQMKRKLQEIEEEKMKERKKKKSLRDKKRYQQKGAFGAAQTLTFYLPRKSIAKRSQNQTLYAQRVTSEAMPTMEASLGVVKAPRKKRGAYKNRTPKQLVWHAVAPK